MKVHYAAQYAAEGGPGADLPQVEYNLLADETTGAMGIAFDHARRLWVLTNPVGQVFAESENPGDLAEWMAEFIESLGRMYEQGELV